MERGLDFDIRVFAQETTTTGSYRHAGIATDVILSEGVPTVVGKFIVGQDDVAILVVAAYSSRVTVAAN